MKVLPQVTPSPEQLPIISNPQAGATLIRGAAGSGKTTTALLMLLQLSEFWLRHRERNNNPDPVQILVLTFNRTLRGYISHLATQQVNVTSNVNIEISTFGKWAWELTGEPDILNTRASNSHLLGYGYRLPIPSDFLCDEVEYCLGRFLPDNRDRYLSVKRVGRGIAPRMERPMRERLVNEVIIPYEHYKQKNDLQDWNDLAVELVAEPKDIKYDIVITDETQDFSANQMRAVMQHVHDNSTTVFVLDAAQRIYPRGWNWREVGINLNPNRSFRLRENHRNTIEICRLAKPLLDGLDLSDDGTIPDLDSCQRHGPVPVVIKSKFSTQCSYAIERLQDSIDLTAESVAFVHPKAGGWFNYLRGRLDNSGFPFVELSRQAEWPRGTENIALISMHSAKGLEFDHIFVLGLDEETTPHGNEEGDSAWENLRRLLAMTITRGRQSVTIGCKPNTASSLFDCLDPDTFEEIVL
jgi:DNA helicase IV